MRMIYHHFFNLIQTMKLQIELNIPHPFGMLCNTNLNNILSLILLMLKLRLLFQSNNNNRLHKEQKREEREEGGQCYSCEPSHLKHSEIFLYCACYLGNLEHLDLMENTWDHQLENAFMQYIKKIVELQINLA